MAKQGFSIPKLFNYDGDLSKEWYAGFRHTDPATGIRKPFQIRMGINYHSDLSGRKSEGNAVVDLVKNALQSGWNPHAEDIKDFIIRTTSPAEHITQKPFNAALDFAFDSKCSTLAPKSQTDIRGVKDFVKTAAEKLSLHTMPIVEVERQHIKMILDQVGKDRQATYNQEREQKFRRAIAQGFSPDAADRSVGKARAWSGNSYNKYRQFLQILFAELEEYNAVKFNPCFRIASKPEIKTNKYRHATDKEEQLIKECLREKYPQFLTYLAFEYLTGIRPVELFGIQVADIDWFNQCIDIHATDGKSKTRSARKVPIPNSLLPYIEGLNLQDADPNDHIFSTYFKPGPKRKKRDYATKLWKQLIIDGLGLKAPRRTFCPRVVHSSAVK